MRASTKTILALALLILPVIVLVEVNAMSSGAPQMECSQCHVGSEAKEIEVSIEGLPEEYEPGKTYTFKVMILKGPICEEGSSCGGFAAISTAGTLKPADTVKAFETTIDGETGITHTKEGSLQREWELVWVAPEDGEAVIKISVIAADGDGSFNNDAYTFKEIILKPKPKPTPTTTIETRTITTTELVTRTTEETTTEVVEEGANPAVVAGIAVVFFLVGFGGYLAFSRRS